MKSSFDYKFERYFSTIENWYRIDYIFLTSYKHNQKTSENQLSFFVKCSPNFSILHPFESVIE